MNSDESILQILLEYTLDDLKKIHQKWIEKEVGEENFNELVSFIENQYKEVSVGGKIPFQYINKILSLIKKDGLISRRDINLKFSEFLEKNIDSDIFHGLFAHEMIGRAGKYFKEYLKLRNIEYDSIELDDDEINEIIKKMMEIPSTWDKFVSHFKELAKEYQEFLDWKNKNTTPEFLENTDEARVYRINSFYMALTLSKGAKWCITDHYYYTIYDKICDLYVVIPKTLERYEFEGTSIERKFLLSLWREMDTSDGFMILTDLMGEIDNLKRSPQFNKEALYNFLDLHYFIENDDSIEDLYNELKGMNEGKVVEIRDLFLNWLFSIQVRHQYNLLSRFNENKYNVSTLLETLSEEFVVSYYSSILDRNSLDMSEFQMYSDKLSWFLDDKFGYIEDVYENFVDGAREKDLLEIVKSLLDNNRVIQLKSDFDDWLSSIGYDPIEGGFPKPFEFHDEKDHPAEISLLEMYVKNQEIFRLLEKYRQITENSNFEKLHRAYQTNKSNKVFLEIVFDNLESGIESYPHYDDLSRIAVKVEKINEFLENESKISKRFKDAVYNMMLEDDDVFEELKAALITLSEKFRFDLVKNFIPVDNPPLKYKERVEELTNLILSFKNDKQ
ncbi:MAG: hypothetical protein N3A54_00765 [Patescibacteria group bacterium]|nr:hypothetical protein [Patescibacteria group bacterium]